MREGREETEDQPQVGRPVTETTSGNIEEVRCLIDEDLHVIIDEIQVQSGTSRGTIERVTSDYLQLKNTTTRWVSSLLTDVQRAERVHLSLGEISARNVAIM